MCNPCTGKISTDMKRNTNYTRTTELSRMGQVVPSTYMHTQGKKRMIGIWAVTIQSLHKCQKQNQALCHGSKRTLQI